MNISQAAEQSGLPVRSIRYYEEIGLVGPGRRDNGYRHYTRPNLYKFAFLQRARARVFHRGLTRSVVAL